MSSASPMGSGSNLNQQGIGNVNSNPQGTMSMNLQMNAMKMGNNMMLGSTQFSTNFNPTMLPNTNQGFNQGMMMHGNQGILSQQQMGVATNTGMLGNQMNPNMINPNLLNNPQMNQGYLNTMGNMNNPHFNQQQNQGYRGN